MKNLVYDLQNSILFNSKYKYSENQLINSLGYLQIIGYNIKKLNEGRKLYLRLKELLKGNLPFIQNRDSLNENDEQILSDKINQIIVRQINEARNKLSSKQNRFLASDSSKSPKHVGNGDENRQLKSVSDKDDEAFNLRENLLDAYKLANIIEYAMAENNKVNVKQLMQSEDELKKALLDLDQWAREYLSAFRINKKNSAHLLYLLKSIISN